MKGIGSLGGASDIFALRQQLLDRNDALRALRENKAGEGVAAPKQGGVGESFKSALSSVNETQVKAQELTSAYERGEVTDVAKVMIARQEAGVAFEATLQVRNKLLTAYQDIMRMGV